ncbi:MAG TPA: hypothetical protein VE760_08270 [Acidimicrobiales bacterium]|nr:hypothetical protein [Acidimicrobiales bacterium]
MASSPEFASDGTTLLEVIRRLEADGYTGQMAAEEGGLIRCYTCRQDSSACDVHLEVLRRTEGASDPADMVAVAALTCPRCGARGTVALKYGPEASPEEDEVLGLLDDAHRRRGGPEAS